MAKKVKEYTWKNIPKPSVLMAKTAKAKGVSLAQRSDGKFFVYTHRARSAAYTTIGRIPKSVIEFIESTG